MCVLLVVRFRKCSTRWENYFLPLPLKLFHRDVDGRITRRDRTWAPGRGHIGLCYAQRELLYSPDILESKELMADVAEGNKDKYRTFISAPIFFSFHDLEKVRGVLVITSSEPNQFDLAVHDRFVKSITMILSMVFVIADTKLEKGTQYV